MTQPAGWYHAEGDPQGTQRYWDGSQWVGEPQAVASTPPPPPGAGYGAAAGTGEIIELEPLDYWKRALNQWNIFEGRARRAEYWWFTAVNIGIGFVIAIIGAVIGLSFLDDLFNLVILVPSLAVGCRRLHDIGRSGWWQLLILVPVIGWIVLLVFAVSDSKPEPNQYGRSPKYG